MILFGAELAEQMGNVMETLVQEIPGVKVMSAMGKVEFMYKKCTAFSSRIMCSSARIQPYTWYTIVYMLIYDRWFG
jgi:hypothetical protein